jgi:hypothetical protein
VPEPGFVQVNLKSLLESGNALTIPLDALDIEVEQR